LADPNRRKILTLLKENDLTAGEIAAAFTISKPSISHHLNLLRRANLVLSEKRGQKIIYSLNTTVFQEIIQWFYELKQKE
jgi:ArsR family transcriptional regulator